MNYCVYEHWRPDTNVCFYVGKGKLRRARNIEARNDRHGKIVAKLLRNGFKPEIRLIAQGLSGTAAIDLEIQQISLRRLEGVDLANYTNGGDGTPGYRMSVETRAKIAAKAKGRVMSPEAIEKAAAGRRGQKRSAETRAKQSASAAVAQKKRFAKVMRTKKGRSEVSRHMTAMSQKAASDPALCARRSENAKALWADPAYRTKVLLARRS